MYSLYYMILNDDYTTIHYVGITSKTLEERLKSHIYQCSNKHYQNRIHQKGYLQRFLSKHLETDSISLIEIESGLTRQDAILAEIKHIKYLKEKHPLKNTSSGGEIFEESAHIYKTIHKYDFDGNLCGTYKGSVQAAKSVNLSSYSKITDCCNGKLHWVKGFVWRYEQDSFYKYPIKRKNTKDLYRIYDLKGNILHDKVNGLEKVKELLEINKRYSFHTKNPIGKGGSIRTVLNKYIVINLKYSDHTLMVDEYFNINLSAKRYANSTLQSRLKNIKDLIVVFKDKTYIEFDSVTKLKEEVFGTNISRCLSPYVIQSVLYKSQVLIWYDGKKASHKTINNLTKKLDIDFSKDFQEIKDIVRTIGKPMTIEEFLAKIQLISIV